MTADGMKRGINMKLFINKKGFVFTLIITALFMIPPLGPAAWGASFSFSYDDAGRLISAESSDGYKVALTYDSNGNLLNRVIGEGETPPTPTPTSEESSGGRSGCFVGAMSPSTGSR